tara:strand:- start:278 stop:577 length:300 start_codon:yes stop_codon:yes gene_type:complete
MAIFELAIADADVQRVFDAVCNNYNRPEKIENPNFDSNSPQDEETNPLTIDNPESQGDFVHRIVRQFLAEHVAAYEIQKAKDEAAAAVSVSVDISDPQP